MQTSLLITGAAGKIGTLLRPRLAKRGRLMKLVDTQPIREATSAEQVITASVTDRKAMVAACAGVDAILHLAGIDNEAPWDEILSINVGGTRTLLEVAAHVGIGRVILASSSHAVGFHKKDVTPLPATLLARPDTYYGFSKAAIEALGSLFADRYGMDVACVRIGTCQVHPPDRRALATWLSPNDAASLVEACLSAPRFGYRVVWGISRNTRRWWSLTEGEALGYFPVEDAESFISKLGQDATLSSLGTERVGGRFCEKPLGVRDPSSVTIRP